MDASGNHVNSIWRMDGDSCGEQHTDDVKEITMAMNSSDMAREAIDRIGDLFDACGYIHDAGGCDRCPLKTTCLDEETFMQVADSLTYDRIYEFLGFAEDIENHDNEEDWENYQNWLKSETERELWEN